MPALKIFGRKWLTSTDDLVFPCVFEMIWRAIILTFMSMALCSYWTFLELNVVIEDGDAKETISNNSLQNATSCHFNDVIFIKTFLTGVNGIVALNMPILLLMIYHSSRGSITDTKARRFVAPLLYIKIFLILPEIALNVMGTIWIFCGVVQCLNPIDTFTNTSIEVCTIFYWIVLCLINLGFMIAYDPLGAKEFRKIRDGNDNFDLNKHIEMMHTKITELWIKRFRFAFCCVAKDEFGDEAITQSAELFSHLFRGTDLVPSDILAGSILLRVRQKKEQREHRRIQMLNDVSPRYSSDLSRVFNPQCPPWMTLKNAQHFLRFAVSSYGWPMVCAISPCRGCLGFMRKVTCCAKMRNKSNNVIDDNCCHCNVAGAKYSSRIENDDVIFASFKNQVFETPFLILVDHSMKAVVLTIRGSWSVNDVFTDLAAAPKPFQAKGMPAETVAHYGMCMCCDKILADLEEDNLLDNSLNQFPEYEFVITGHSLGAGLAVLVGSKLRPKYPSLKVYGFATPSGLLSREAAKYTEQFVFTLVIGDDFAARATVESVESLKFGIVETLESCKLPKYRVILNGFTYAILGIPSRDLEKSWYEVTEIPPSSHSSNLLDQQVVATITHHAFGNPTVQTPRRKLYIGGRILHIVRKKKSEMEKGSLASNYEMRWSQPEDFLELKVMPRMLLDHFPQNILKVLTSILKEKKSCSTLSVEKI